MYRYCCCGRVISKKSSRITSGSMQTLSAVLCHADLERATCSCLWQRGYSICFGQKNGANFANLRQSGLLSLLDTLMTPQEQYGGLLFLFCCLFCSFYIGVCGHHDRVYWMEFFQSTKMSLKPESTWWWAENAPHRKKNSAASKYLVSINALEKSLYEPTALHWRLAIKQGQMGFITHLLMCPINRTIPASMRKAPSLLSFSTDSCSSLGWGMVRSLMFKAPWRWKKQTKKGGYENIFPILSPQQDIPPPKHVVEYFALFELFIVYKSKQVSMSLPKMFAAHQFSTSNIPFLIKKHKTKPKWCPFCQLWNFTKTEVTQQPPRSHLIS